MFNSPLHYCQACKQYVELDQSGKDCALKHNCKVSECPTVRLFSPPTANETTNPSTRDDTGKA